MYHRAHTISNGRRGSTGGADHEDQLGSRNHGSAATPRDKATTTSDAAVRTDPRSPQRREALKLLGRTVGALAAGSAALASGACLSSLVDPDAISRIPLADVPQGRSVVFHAARRVSLARDGEAITARLMICTHEFCDLTWLDAENNYHCNCHAAKFFPDGRPKDGPVSKPMFEIPTRVEGDTLVLGPAGELQLTG